MRDVHPLIRTERNLISYLHPLIRIERNLINYFNPLIREERNLINYVYLLTRDERNLISYVYPLTRDERNLKSYVYPLTRDERNLINLKKSAFNPDRIYLYRNCKLRDGEATRRSKLRANSCQIPPPILRAINFQFCTVTAIDI